MTVSRKAVERFFPGFITFSTGVRLDLRPIDETWTGFSVDYVGRSDRLHCAMFWIPKTAKNFPWSPEFWAEQLKKAEEYDQVANRERTVVLTAVGAQGGRRP